MMRNWNSDTPDEGSRFAVGNGDLLVYAQGPNLSHIYGVPYTMPSWGQLELETPQSVHAHTQREPGTAILHHTLNPAQGWTAYFTDLTPPDLPFFLRIIETDRPLSFRFHPHEAVRSPVPLTDLIPSGIWNTETLLLIRPACFGIGALEVVREEKSLMLVTQGEITVESVTGENTFRIQVPAGRSSFGLLGGNRFPELMRHAQALSALSPETLERETRQEWNRFARSRSQRIDLLPAHPERERITAAIDSVCTLIKAQQSRDGGVMAGHHYEMAYVRDMSGVYRGLMKAGHRAEAKAILDFWWNRFRLHGNLWNAEGMGNPESRLCFPNDEVEVPGYLILNLFHYVEHTGDRGYLREVFPLLEWAFESQCRHLYGGMLGFSGDETYIAGNMFPPYLIDHGSAESTMLFITGGKKLVDFMAREGLGSSWRREHYRANVQEAESSFRKNFVRDGVLTANNPERVEIAEHPASVYGFCQAKMQLENELDLRWLMRNEQGYYVCPEKLQVPMEPRTTKHFVLNSISLAMIYHHANLYPLKELGQLAEPAIRHFEESGRISSEAGSNRGLGYDYGFMLYALTALDHPRKDKALSKMLDVLDPSGAWCEFYTDDIPGGCRCRAWESAINLEAMLFAMDSIKGDTP